MKMSDNINTWTDVQALLLAWWNGDVPLSAVLLSVVMTILRVAYTGGDWKKMMLEGALCGALTLTVASSLDYFGLSQSLAVALGGTIGFIGVDQIRALALRFLVNRFGGGNANQ